jgi:hypothetical protein
MKRPHNAAFRAVVTWDLVGGQVFATAIHYRDGPLGGSLGRAAPLGPADRRDE